MYVCVSKWVQGRGPSPTLSPTDPVPRGLLTLWARAGRVYAYMYVCVRAHMCVSADVRAHAHAHAHERAHVCVRVCVCVCHQRVPMAPLHLTLLLPLTCRGMAWWRACVCGNAARLLRGSKKYKPVPSPLLRLHFWRVCLDEAQMVENTTAKAAEMASKLHSGTRCPVLPPPVPAHTRRACASSCAPAPLLSWVQFLALDVARGARHCAALPSPTTWPTD